MPRMKIKKITLLLAGVVDSYADIAGSLRAVRLNEKEMAAR